MKRFLSRITKKQLFIFGTSAIICAVVIGLLAVPPRDASWENNNNLSGIGNFFSNLFSPQSITVLLLGRPGDEYTGGGLTDSLIVIHFNPDTEKLYLVSIPRDLWISDDKEQFKINESLRKQKTEVAVKKIEEITGFDLDGYAVIDLAFTQTIIDALGGVDIILQQPAVDWVSGYTMPAGAVHLNGEDAIWLIRNRFSPEGDFFREENQQYIVNAAFKKFMTLSQEQKISFLNRFVVKAGLLSHIDISITRLMPYVLEAEKLKNIEIENIVLDFSTKLFMSSSVPVQGPTSTLYASVLLPAEGFEKYDAIREYIKEKTE